jgi:hypothetical protein
MAVKCTGVGEPSGIAAGEVVIRKADQWRTAAYDVLICKMEEEKGTGLAGLK